MTDRTITVEASGQVRSEADGVRVEIEANGHGESQTAARRDCETTLGAVRDAIGTFDFPADAFERRAATVQHRSSLFEVDESDPAYHATVECTLTCRPSLAEDVFVAVGDAGGAVTGMDHIVDPGRWNDLHERALSAATERARRKAAAIADAEGVTLGPVRTVEAGDDGGLDSIVDEALASCDDDQVDLDGVEVTASVEAVFEIE